VNDDAIKAHGAVGVALASLSHQGADRARSPADALAADRVLPTGETVLVTVTDDARVKLGELAMTVETTSAPQAGIEDRAVGVGHARRGKTLALITF
jgi:hypothetical protein